MIIDNKLYICSIYKKSVKFTSDVTQYINIYKISSSLLYCQSLKLELVKLYYD